MKDEHYTKLSRRLFCLLLTGTILLLDILHFDAVAQAQNQPLGQGKDVVDIGSRLELFVDHFLIDEMTGTHLKLNKPRYAGVAFPMMEKDRPWENPFFGYFSIVQRPEKVQIYYQAKTKMTASGEDEVTCYAESPDGISWSKPDLGLFEVFGTKKNNVVLDYSFRPVCHNFSVFYDTKPGVPENERYKGLGGLFPLRNNKHSNGLLAFVSGDGIHWNKLREEAVVDKSLHPNEQSDTCQVSVFWSEPEQCYVCYLRCWINRPGGIKNEHSRRWIGRTTSKDFLRWEKIQLMKYVKDDGQDQFYLPNTFPYFRAPHIYIALPTRLCDFRRVLSPERLKAIGVPKHSWHDMSDIVLMTSRGGLSYDRTFRESFIRPGMADGNWSSRANFAALGVVQTGPNEMSIYSKREYISPSAHVGRFTLPLDRFASVNAPYTGGEFVTRPLKFSGNALCLNLSTSASGYVQTEIQDAQGQPIPGYALDDCLDTGGDEIARKVEWKNKSSDLSALAGHTIRLRFVMKDADLYAIQFTDLSS